MIRKLRKALLIQISLLLALSGCGNKEAADAGADIVLLEPVGASVNYEQAAYRSIYNVTTYQGGVYPLVTEYAFEKAQKFAGYTVLPGDTVKAGDILLTSDTADIDKRIEDKTEALTEKENNHLEYVADMEKQIAEAKEETAYRKEMFGLLSEENQDALYVRLQGLYRMAVYNEEMLKKELSQNTQIYELEYAYEKEQLDKMLEERDKATIIAKSGGVIVAESMFNEGDTMQADVPVIAVSDSEDVVLKCDYISPTQMAKAEAAYAYIGGQKYEVLYQKMDSEEYTRLSDAGSKMYSTFLFMDAATDVEVGDAATIVLERNSSEEVVSISRSAVHKDESGNYVYVYKDGETVHTAVKTGLSDGTYIEIESGLSAGDLVMVESKQEYGNQKAVLERGTYAVDFGGRGYLYYSDATYVRNEVEHGTVFMGEYKVSQYQMVEKGDVIATVRVEVDDAQIASLERQVLRLEERLADYQKAWDEEYALRDYSKESPQEKEAWAKRRVAYDKEVIKRTETINEIKETITEMQNASATKKIVAHRSGIVTWRSDYGSEDILSFECAIANIADINSACLLVENKNQMLNYGTELEISCTTWGDAGEETITVPGVVVNVASPGLSDKMYTDYAIVKFTEPIDHVAMSYVNEQGQWRRINFKASGTAYSFDNVIMVPKSAVTDINGSLYVNVLQEDGSIVSRSFIAGGSDIYNYWVITGLEEGMTICYE